MIYLDTHCVLWIYYNKKELFSKKAIELIEENELFISPMIELELNYLHEINRIPHSADKLLNDLYLEINLQVKNVSFSKLIKSANQLKWTRDSFDRLICSQASLDNMNLLTKDKNILENFTKAVWN